MSDTGAHLLDEIAAWYRRFVYTTTEADHDLLALWTVHSHLAEESYTTPRLQLDSPMPGSGKTTVLDHFSYLCHNPIMMASISSSALLTRMLSKGPRTVLIDEADRSLNADNPVTTEVLAILNSGYKRGASRPVLVPVKGGGWEEEEMPTFAPVAMAGNNPNLPDDTRSRMLRVLLLPDLDGTAEESDWELIEDDAHELRERIEAWATGIRADVRTTRPTMPDGITGRFREKWSPLARIADAAGGRWPEAVRVMARQDREQFDMDKQDGLIREKPAMLLLRHLHEVWPDGAAFLPTEKILSALIERYPDAWGKASAYGKEITAQRMGRMLASSFKLNSGREANTGPRGYHRAALQRIWQGMKVGTPLNRTGETGSTGSTGDTGATSAGSASSTGSYQTPVPEPGSTSVCQSCGRASGFSLIGGQCRNCHTEGNTA